MRILNAGADFVLGRETFSNWADWEKALPIVKGDQDSSRTSARLGNGCEILFRQATRIRASRLCGCNLGFPDNAFFTDKGFGSLGIS